MSLHLSDLFDLAHLDEMLEAGYVRRQDHPTEPLAILNYTEKAAYERVWTPVTRVCRGLIYNVHSGEIVARPFPKFWNYGEPEAGQLDLNARVVVTDKVDGSLGILYPTSSGYAVATRGSFTSVQAEHATKVWLARYADVTEVEPGITMLFEIVFPENRIVCDYGDMDDLVLLGGMDIAAGTPIRPGFLDWSGPTAATFDYRTLAEALAAPPRPGAEGFVIRLPDHDHAMVKLKQADYVELHRIVTGLNARTVWEMLGAGKTVADICEPLPDELHGWVRDLAEELQREADELFKDTVRFHGKILARMPDGWTRKDYAIEASKSTLRPWLFNLLDDKDPRPAIWKTVRPSGDRRPVTVSEDAE